jgi:sec-independent protein translocase protein TatA
MFNLGPLELMAIFVVALLVFGPDKLPEIGRQVGRAVREFRRIQSSFQTDLGDAFDSHLAGPVVPEPTPVAPPAPSVPSEAPGPPEANGTSGSSAVNGTSGAAGEVTPSPGPHPSEGAPPDAASR